MENERVDNSVWNSYDLSEKHANTNTNYVASTPVFQFPKGGQSMVKINQNQIDYLKSKLLTSGNATRTVYVVPAPVSSFSKAASCTSFTKPTLAASDATDKNYGAPIPMGPMAPTALFPKASRRSTGLRVLRPIRKSRSSVSSAANPKVANYVTSPPAASFASGNVKEEHGSSTIKRGNGVSKYGDWSKMVWCLLCRRQFLNKDILAKHETSKVHKDKLSAHINKQDGTASTIEKRNFGKPTFMLTRNMNETLLVYKSPSEDNRYYIFRRCQKNQLRNGTISWYYRCLKCEETGGDKAANTRVHMRDANDIGRIVGDPEIGHTRDCARLTSVDVEAIRIQREMRLKCRTGQQPSQAYHAAIAEAGVSATTAEEKMYLVGKIGTFRKNRSSLYANKAKKNHKEICDLFQSLAETLKDPSTKLDASAWATIASKGKEILSLIESSAKASVADADDVREGAGSAKKAKKAKKRRRCNQEIE